MAKYMIKRIYEDPNPSDGYRVLVDRLWPRGVSKESAKIDSWEKDLAPSAELRRYFNHDQNRFHEFKRQYYIELENNDRSKEIAVSLAKHKNITLLYGAKDPKNNHAVVLKQWLESY